MFVVMTFFAARPAELTVGELKGGLETRLYAAVREWVAREWPFKKVAYPGRDIDWAAWQSIPDEKR